MTKEKKFARDSITLDKFQEYCTFHLNLAQIAFKFGVHEDTIRRWLKKNLKMTFDEARALYQVDFKMKLLQAQYDSAFVDRHPTMLKWLGIQYLGQKESLVDVQSTNRVFQFAYDLSKEPVDS